MYYINRARIDDRISFIAYIKQAITRLQAQWIEGEPLLVLAEERVIHLAIEVVTDIGSDLIDGLMLREASSYVDIVKVLQGEDVFPQHTANVLIELVELRKELVQQYTDWDRSRLHHVIPKLNKTLEEFKVGVEKFLDKELHSF